MHGDDHRGVLAALGLVDRHGPGMLQLHELLKAQRRHAPVKIHRQRFVLGVYAEDIAYVAVVDARARFRLAALSLLPVPDYIIVIPDLHYPVALTEGNFAKNFLVFALRGRVQRRLEPAVERN